jgi:hypothetical protein
LITAVFKDLPFSLLSIRESNHRLYCLFDSSFIMILERRGTSLKVRLEAMRTAPFSHAAGCVVNHKVTDHGRGKVMDDYYFLRPENIMVKLDSPRRDKSPPFRVFSPQYNSERKLSHRS